MIQYEMTSQLLLPAPPTMLLSLSTYLIKALRSHSGNHLMSWVWNHLHGMMQLISRGRKSWQRLRAAAGCRRPLLNSACSAQGHIWPAGRSEGAWSCNWLLPMSWHELEKLEEQQHWARTQLANFPQQGYCLLSIHSSLNPLWKDPITTVLRGNLSSQMLTINDSEDEEEGTDGEQI